MDFDQMMDAWQAQDAAPLDRVHRDLLGLVVRQERAGMTRAVRREWWLNLAAAVGMAGLGGAVLWWFLRHDGPPFYAAAAAVGTAGFVLWLGALWLSRRRQARRERDFGSSLRDELRRNLAMIDHQLAQAGSWRMLALWSAPSALGASLLVWLIAEINDNTSTLFDGSLILFILASVGWTVVDTSRRTRRDLLPRRRRLGELLAMLDG